MAKFQGNFFPPVSGPTSLFYSGLRAMDAEIAVLKEKPHVQSDLKLMALVTYLEKKAYEVHGGFGFNGLPQRLAFVTKVIVAAENNEQYELSNLLNSPEVKSFKGFFTRRLYDLLVDYRSSLNIVDAEMARLA